MSQDQQFLMIAALQHYAYCPRQFALIHIERAWSENRFTMEGNLLHARVDSGVAEKRGSVRYERSVRLRSKKYNLIGVMDLLEIERSSEIKYFPIEYKRGKTKLEDWDRIQLCAQALCIEEMRKTVVYEGAIWYWQTRKRENVQIDESLRAATITAITGAQAILNSRITPPPIDKKKRCRACSLKDSCNPDVFKRDRSINYVNELLLG